MLQRIAALSLFVGAAYVAWATLSVGAAMARSLFEDGWLGPEPELLYLVAGALLVALLLWLGLRLWRRGSAARPNP
jgi:hypothetical protein